MRVEQIGPATLYCGDCFDVLPEIRSVDAVLTDMPYGCTACAWDKTPDLAAFWRLALPAAKENAAFCLCADMRFAVALVNSQPRLFRYDIVWRKSVPVGFLNAKRAPLRAHELVLVFYRRLPAFHPQKTAGKPYRALHRVFSSNYGTQRPTMTCSDGSRYPLSVLDIPSESRGAHPTQKPVALMEWLVKSYSAPGELVLDPFMGAGSTGVAAVASGARFVGVEMAPEYFDHACRRIEQAVRAAEGAQP